MERLNTFKIKKSRIHNLNLNENWINLDNFQKNIDLSFFNHSNFSNLLNKLRQNYDYIVIDSAPLVLVSDTIPLLKQVDLVIYTVRAHFTDKKLTIFINDLVENKKVNNIGLVLNGIKAVPNSSYYKYGYGYRYSYQYKYNYGYGYGYGSDKSS